VSHAWIVDPIACTLEVLRLHEGRWLIMASFKGDDVVRAEPFDAVELALADIWAPADAAVNEDAEGA
jgi:Uma2 family endonuclease